MKKIMSILTAIILVCITGMTTITVGAERIKTKRFVGDVNNDQKVDAIDASIILQHYALLSSGLKSQIFEAVADVNHDGQINAVDASVVLSRYATSATGKKIYYDVIFVEEEDDTKQFCKNELVEFNGISWYIHNTMELSDYNLYSKEKFLTNSEIFAIANKYENNWYGIYLDNTKTEVYILINPASLEYFDKVGKVELLDQIVTETISAETTTTTATATTTTTSTSVTTTTTTTQATTSTITSSSSTLTSTTSVTTSVPVSTTAMTSTNISCTSTVNLISSTYSDWQCLAFTGDWWNVRSTTEIGDNAIDHLDKNEFFYIKRNVVGDWYEICSKNKDESGKFIRIDSESRYLFTPVKVLSNYYFVGEKWNVRTSKDLSNDNNIVGTLKFGDIVSVVEFYEDGWAKIICNQVEGNIEMYVVLQPFVRIS